MEPTTKQGNPIDWDALHILSTAKLSAMSEIVDRAYSHARGTGYDRSLYEALEAWRTAANAWDFILSRR